MSETPKNKRRKRNFTHSKLHIANTPCKKLHTEISKFPVFTLYSKFHCKFLTYILQTPSEVASERKVEVTKMSKKKLISLILVLTLVVALIVGGIIFGVYKYNHRDDDKVDDPIETPTEDKSNWKSCEHEYDNACDPDCNKCGEKRIPADHVYDDENDVDCNVCGHIREVGCSHEYDNACDPDCNKCGEVRVPADHVVEIIHGKAATCTENGLTDGEKCSVCGKILKEQEVILASHTPDVIKGKEPTCTEIGMTDGQKCSVCGQMLKAQEPIPELGHDEEIIPGYAATCTSQGLSDGKKCKVCGETTQNQVVIDKLGHEWEDVYTTDETHHWKKCIRCTDIFEYDAHTFNENAVCTVCGYGCEHKSGQWSTVIEATCTVIGKDVCTCDNCGVIFEIKWVPKLNHTPGDEATCTTDQTCTVCGTVLVEATGHDWTMPTCTSPKTCKSCGFESEDPADQALGHVPQYTLPECLKDNVCIRCGEVVEPARDHQYSSDCDEQCNVCGNKRTPTAEHKVVTSQGYGATCTKNGLTDGQYCSECGKIIKEQETIKYTGHNYSYKSDADGHWLECQKCSEKIENESHKWYNACDKDCNVCGYTRETTHRYTNLYCDTKCASCGAERVAPHKYLGECDTTCELCSYTRVTSAEHTYTASCDNDCNVCGYKRFENPKHEYTNDCDPTCNICGDTRSTAGHTYSATWSQGETGHWKQCSCGARDMVSAHRYSSSCDETCEDCGYVREVKHTYDNDCSTSCNKCGGGERTPVSEHKYTYVYNENNHWKQCAICGARTTNEKHTLSGDKCTTCGYTKTACTHSYAYDCSSVCTLCGVVRTPISDHNWEAHSDETRHWQQCSMCGAERNAQIHTYITVQIESGKTRDTEATNLAYKHNIACADCGYVTEQKAHVFIHDGVCECGRVTDCEHEGGEATCVQLKVCSKCHCEYGEYAEHEEYEYSKEISATCTSVGYKAIIKCRICDKTLQEADEIPVAGHKLVSVPGKAPTCSAEGLETAQKCTVCELLFDLEDNQIDEQKKIDKLEHKWVESTDGYKAPTCTATGLRVLVCTSCGTHDEKIISANGHVRGEWILQPAPTCTTDGTKVLLCRTCGEEIESQTVTADGHKWGEGVVKEATCISGGYTVYTCTVCKQSEQRDPTSALGHDTEWVIRRPAGCLVNGWKEEICKTCEKTISTSVIDAVGHHTFRETYGSDERGHWLICTVDGCGGIGDVSSHTYENGVCKICSYECQHSGGSATCKDKAICETCGCEYGELGNHIGGAAATCTTNQVCTICHEEIAPELGHDEVNDKAVEATCGRAGLTEGSHCSRCGLVIKEQEKIDATGKHTYIDGTCTGCGVSETTDKHNHVYDDCEDTTCNVEGCDFVRVAPGHSNIYVSGTPATCTEEGKTSGTYCIACLKTTKEQETIAPLGHTDTRWVVDKEATCTDDGHKYELCNICGVKTGEEETISATGHDEVTVTVASTCTTKGYVSVTCKICGATSRTENDSYADHTPGDWITDEEPTCTEKGSAYEVCAVCGQETGNRKEVDVLGHEEIITKYDPTCTDEGKTVYTCKRCNETIRTVIDSEATGHKHGGWKIETSATCTTDGSRYEICAICGQRTGKTETIDATGHNWKSEIKTEASCNSTGELIYRCTVCNGVKDGDPEIIPTTPHQYGNWAVDYDATCENAGRRYRTCSDCGDSIYDEIPAKGHNLTSKVEGGKIITTCTNGCDYHEEKPVDTTEHECKAGGYRIDKAPTCTSTGIKYAVCSICGKDMGEAETIEETGHTLYYITVAPTCKAQGYTTEACSVCDYTKTEYTDPTDCVSGGWVISRPASCTANGEKYEVCANCGEKIGESVSIEASGHNYNITIVLPTCTGRGYTKYECTVCGDTYEDNQQVALDHVSGGWIIDDEASCTVAGSKHEICARCGETIAKETIEASGHDNVTVIVAPTCTEKGYTKNICKVCGYREITAETNPESHQESDWIIGTPASCVSAGERYKVCTVCGATTTTETIKATNEHKYEEIVIAPECNANANLAKNGYTLHFCTVCGDTYKDNEVEWSHSYDEITGICGCGAHKPVGECKHEYSNDCDSTCNICGAIRDGYESGDKHIEIAVPAVDATCTSTGLTAGVKCERCGAVIKRQETVAKKPHEYNYDCSTDCKNCGTTTRPGAEHGYTYACDTDCKYCGNTTRPGAEHDYTYSCSTTCKYCQQVTNPNAKHDYKIRSNSTGHWNVCSVCGQTDGEIKAHVYSEDASRGEDYKYICYDTECDECGYKRDVTHTLDEHNVCEICKYEVTCVHVYDDCEDVSCNLCGQERVAPGHSGGTATCTRLAKCEVCGKSYGSKADHTWNVENATCTVSKMCTVCYTVAQEKLGHEYNETVTAPTCLEQGFTTHKCSRCNDEYTSNYVSARGHNIVTITGKPASCTETGLTDGKMCDRCNTVTVQQTEIALKPHEYGNDNKCINCGHEECQHEYDNECVGVKCIHCGEIRSSVPGHKYEAYNYGGTNYNYTFENGASTHYRKCTVCENIETKGHTYDNSCDTTCNDCGAVRTTEHRFSTAWTKDGSGHWHVCSICGAKSDKLDHTYDNVCATTCSTCKYKRSVEHVLSKEYTTDGNFHWYVCTTPGCGYTTTKEVHKYENSCDKTCDTCGYERETKHQYIESNYVTTNGGHYHVCTVCGQMIESAIAEHTLTWQKDSSSHWQLCSVCGFTTNKSGHNYDNSCDTECNDCGYTRSAKHNWSAFWSSDASGHWYECSTPGCGAVKGGQKTSHNYSSDCASNCSICGYSRYANGDQHSYKSDTYSYNAQGHWQVCTKCNASTAVQGHTYDGTCGTNCTVCNYSRGSQHVYSTVLSTDNDTYHYYKCTKCGAIDEISKQEHKYSYDCDKTCDICGHERNVDHKYSDIFYASSDGITHEKRCVYGCGSKTDIKNHDWANDCDTKCDTCGFVRTTEHKYDNNCDTTCNVCGEVREITHAYNTSYVSNASGHWRECTVCGDKVDEAGHSFNASMKCTVCGYDGSVKHTWHTDYKSDGTNHWQYCTGGCGDNNCTATTGVAKHKFATNCSETCSVCGAKNANVKHTYSTGYYSNDKGHWQLCLICKESTETSVHVYDNGCDTNCNICGYQRDAQHVYGDEASGLAPECDDSCNICGATRVPPHAYGDAYKSDASGHWYECTSCGKRKSESGHRYKFTCSEYCEVCQYKNEEAKHAESAVWSSDAEGHWTICTQCGTTVTTKANHNYDNACDAECNICKYTRQVGQHQYQTGDKYTSNDNYHWQQCTICYKISDAGKTAHKYSSECDSTCDICGHVRQAKSHDFTSSTLKYDDTYHWEQCKYCDAQQNKVKHSYTKCNTSCDGVGCNHERTVEHDDISASNETHHWTECTICGRITGKSTHTWTKACQDTCPDCNYHRDTTHSWGADYKYDGTYHWKECYLCGARQEDGITHDWANDCDEKCDICGYTRTVKHEYSNDCDTTCNLCGKIRITSHNWQTSYSSDDTYHWIECSVCHSQKETGKHTYSGLQCTVCRYEKEEGACDHEYDYACYGEYCKKCGFKRTTFASHTYDSDCSTVCKVCGHGNREANHDYEFGCSTTCRRCGATRSASHQYSSQYATDENGHWKACIYCNTNIQSGSQGSHVFAPACSESCSVCGYKRTSGVEHTYGTDWITDGNKHWKACTACGNKKEENVHGFKNACDTTCPTCGYTRKTSHAYSSDWENDATSHWHVCTICKAVGEKSNHSMVLKSISNLQHTRSCSTCGFVSATESHSWGEDNTCACGEVKSITENYGTSVDYINLNGPFKGYGGNTNDRDMTVTGYGTDFSGKISIKGWCITDSGIAGYYYSIDGGTTWIQIDTTGCLSDATSGHLGVAKGYNVDDSAPLQNCVFSSLSIDLSGYWGKTLDITFAALTKNGAYAKIITLKDVTVWRYSDTGNSTVQGDMSGGGAHGFSIDSLKVNGRIWTVNSAMADGIAHPPYGQNHTSVTIKAGEYVTLSGWVGYDNLTITAFGYCFANSSGNKITSASYMGNAESGVTSDSAGGSNAKRYIIDVDTSSLEAGIYRVYFIVQLSNGKTPIIQYVDLNVTGKDNVWDGNSDVVKADKDNTSSFSTAPVQISGNTYTMDSNFKFSASASYNSSNYRFNLTSSGVTFNFSSDQFEEEFNRFKIRYVSSTPVKAVLTYIDSSNNILTDTVYLENGQGTFTCLIKGYLDGDMAQNITSMTLYPLNATSGSFMLYDIDVENYELYGNDLTYIENAKYKVGVRLAWGGALCYLEDKTCTIDGVRNLINVYDVGRLVQQSWYMNGKNTGNYNGQVWKYNPVQGGDWNNNESRIIDVVMGQCSMYIKSQPMDWGSGSDGKTYTISQSYMENWYTVYDNRLEVNNRFFDFSGINSTSAINQEIPAFYFIGYLNSFAYDAGSGDWGSTNIAYKTDLPFWGNNPSAGDYNSNYNALTRFTVSGSETWGAWYNKDTGWGVGFYTPGVSRFISGRNDHSVYGDTKSPFSAGCSYTAAGKDCKLMSFKAYTYSYLMTTGQVTAIRETFKNTYSTIPSNNLT